MHLGPIQRMRFLRHGLVLIALLSFLIPSPAFTADGTLRLSSATTKPPSVKPVTVSNLRASRKGDHVRLVLDLAKSVKITQQRVPKPDRTIIDLKNAGLSESAKKKIDED